MGNGTFQAKFDYKVSGTANLLIRKKARNSEYLCNSVRDAKHELYTPSTEKFDGYTQYPRPVSRHMNDMKKKRRYFTSGFTRVQSVKVLDSAIPAHLTTNMTSNNWMKKTSRIETAPEFGGLTRMNFFTERARQNSTRGSERKKALINSKPLTSKRDSHRDENFKSLADIESNF